MKLYEKVLTADQKRVLELLAPVMSEQDFYLVGGTALALQVGHRQSVDLDWFTQKTIPDALQLAQSIKGANIPFNIRSVERGTLHGDIEGVRVSFLEYRYPHLKNPILLGGPGYRVASLDDLCCMKLSAIAQRGSRKDFIDLYALLETHASLEEMITMYRSKYQIDDIGHLLYALVYFSDAEKEPLPILLREIKWKTVTETIRKAVKRFAT